MSGLLSQSPPNNAQRAPIACYACRRGKRRCTRTLPACDLCERKSIECAYALPNYFGEIQTSTAGQSRSHSSANSDTIQTNDQGSVVTTFDTDLSNTESSLFDANRAVKFLAPQLFRDAGLEIPRPVQDVPSDVLHELGGSQQVIETASAFSMLSRSWMPIVSRSHYLAAMMSPLSLRRRAFSLLALCMKLCCLSTKEGIKKVKLYRLVKKFYSEVEGTEDLSLQVLQAGILISVFEIGDAIYPAAYLSIGSCARYGLLMGLDKDMLQKMGADSRTTSWLEVEEKRRAWWAILILDRFLNFADPLRTLATQDPNFEYFLPVDDASFYDESTNPEDAIPISQAFGLNMGAFARLAQATYLISQALDAIRSNHTPQQSFGGLNPPSQVLHICRTLEALVRANELEVSVRKLAFCSQSVFSYSGVLLLQQYIWDSAGVRSTQQAYDHMLGETSLVFDTLDRIAIYLQLGHEEQSLMGNECTIFLVDVLYRAIMALHTLGQGKPSPAIAEQTSHLKWFLGHIQTRWSLAAKYKNIAEMKEAFLAAKAL
ncbi:hypothetical protein G7046_g6322 [Stylonectria norvegica]|nr:hypothetical protein G7046_g6322 [Stylonectria norvegica]